MSDLANRLASISRKIVAGGGAGINFENVRIDRASVGFKVEKVGGQWQVKKAGGLPDVESFDALGYMDGKRNNSGNLFKVSSFDFDIRDIAKNVGQVLSRFPEEEGPLTISLETYKIYPAMVFGGYVRGEIKKGFVIDFEGTAELYLDGYGPLGSEVVGYRFDMRLEATKEAEGWYEKIFKA